MLLNKAKKKEREDENNASLQFSMNMKLRRGKAWEKLNWLDIQRPVKVAAAEATEKSKNGMNNSRKMSVGLNVVCALLFIAHFSASDE